MTTPADTTDTAEQPKEGLPNLGKGVTSWEVDDDKTVIYQRDGDPNNTYSVNPETDEVKVSTGGTEGPFTVVNDQDQKEAIKDQYEESKEAMGEANPTPAKKLASEEVAKDNQCVLISNLTEILNKSPPPKDASFYEGSGFESRKDVRYKNIHKIQTDNPASIINKLRMTRGAKDFLNISPHEYSQLTPTIRLYKEYYEEQAGDPIEVEFKFANFVDPVDDLQAMLDSPLQRGVGIGIESFSYRFRGVQPETAKKDIEAELTIYAQNFNELFKHRFGVDSKGANRSYRIIDLLFLEPKYRFLEEGDNRKQREFNPNFYETKAIVGWAATGGGGIISSDLSNAVRENQISLYLIVTNHSFAFEPEGGVRLKINFTARVESMMLDSRSDILSDPKTKQARKERRQVVDDLISKASKVKKEDKNACLDEEVEELKQAYNLKLEGEREDSYLSLLNGLIKQNAIYTAVVQATEAEPDSSAPAYLREARHLERDFKLEVITSVCSEEDDSTSPAILAKTLQKKDARHINYFFLGDLLALAINNVLASDPNESSVPLINYGKIKFMLGPAVVEASQQGRDEDEAQINLGELPVSVDIFTHFMQDKVISKRRNSYPLLSFIRDLIKHLMFEILSPECVGAKKSKIMLDTAQISADAGSGGSDPVAAKIGEDSFLNIDDFESDMSGEGKFVFPSFNRKGLSDNYNYFVIYTFDKAPRGLAFKQKDAKNNENGPQSRHDRDLTNGIYHLSVGSDKGLVKTMDFKATTQKFLKEARYLERDFNPELQLTNVYDVNVNLLGNNLFYPGQRVYINPRGMGSDLLGDPSNPEDPANIVGLGGYHVVKFVDSVIRADGFSTNLSCLFETSGDGIDSSYSDSQTVGGEAGSVLLNCADLEKNIKALTSTLGGKQ